MTTLPSIGTEDLAAYRQAAKRRQEAEQRRRRQRLLRARELARQAAALLRSRFHAQRVAVFGSLTRPEEFGLRSDIDLAAWGIPERDFLRAVAAVTALDGEICVDLVAAEDAPPALRQHLEEEGITI